MVKIRKRTLSTKEQTSQLTLALWVISLVAGILLAVQHVLYERDDDLLRLVIVVGTIGVPTFFLFQQNGWHLPDVINFNVDPTLIVLSGGLGLAVWGIGWWGMSMIQEKALFEIFGTYQQPSIYLPNNLESGWEWLILADVVLIPTGLMLLLWGGLRRQIQDALIWQVILISGGFLGLFGMLLFAQGMSGFFGYGLCGIAAGFASYYARNAWAGFATHATFMYANHAFLDNLLVEMTFENENGLRVPEDYFGMQWLSLVLVSILVAIALIQIIRFRSNRDTGEEPSILSFTSSGWVAIGLAVVIFLLFIVDEAQRRM